MTQLSAHFNLDEFTASSTATRLNIDNSLPDALLGNAQATADMLERVRAALCAAADRDVPIHVDSGYRCEKLNIAVGGAMTSDHLKAMAADIKAPAFGTPYDVAKFLADRRQELGIGQVILEFDSWTHVSTRKQDNPANVAITIDHSGTRCGICA